MIRNCMWFLFFSLIFFGCNTKPGNQNVTVNIFATGEMEVKPDIADFVVNASCVNRNILTSNNCVKKQVDKITKILTESQVSSEDYHTSDISLDKEYYWKNNSQVFRGYRSSVSSTVRLKDLKNLNPILSKLMTQKDLSVSSLAYSHSQMDELANDVYIKALDNSRSLAKKLQLNLEGKSLEIVKISNTNDPLPEIVTAAKFSNRSGAPRPESINFNVGKLTLRKNLKVQYLIKK